MPAKPKRARTPMSDTHKAALAEGREQGRAVRRYLEALEAHKPRRGRKRTPESMEKRLATIEENLPQADPLTRLQLVQERMDLQHQLEAADSTVDMQALEDEFVKAAPDYSRRKGITYAAWWEAGNPASNDVHSYEGTIPVPVLIADIQHATARGMRVVLMPVIFCAGCAGTWRGNLQPSDPPQFMQNYTAHMLLPYAQLAQQN